MRPRPRSVGVGEAAAEYYVDFNFGLFAGEYKYVFAGTTFINAVKSEWLTLDLPENGTRVESVAKSINF